MIDDRNVTKSSTIIRKSQVYVVCKPCSYTGSIVDSSFGVGHTIHLAEPSVPATHGWLMSPCLISSNYKHPGKR